MSAPLVLVAPERSAAGNVDLPLAAPPVAPPPPPPQAARPTTKPTEPKTLNGFTLLLLAASGRRRPATGSPEASSVNSRLHTGARAVRASERSTTSARRRALARPARSRSVGCRLVHGLVVGTGRLARRVPSARRLGHGRLVRLVRVSRCRSLARLVRLDLALRALLRLLGLGFLLRSRVRVAAQHRLAAELQGIGALGEHLVHAV